MTYGGYTTSYLQDASSQLAVVLQENISGQSGPSSFLYPLDSTTPLFQSDPSNNPLWYHTDGLGSVRALSNGSGVVQGDYAYSAFGLNQSTGDTSIVGGGGKTSNDHLFAGEQLDPTGLYYNRARYYNPSIGRFTSRDTFAGTQELPPTLNHFVYTSNNPQLYVDPSGNRQIDSSDVSEAYIRKIVCAVARVTFITRFILCDITGEKRYIRLIPLPVPRDFLDYGDLYPDMMIFNERGGGTGSSGVIGGVYEVEPFNVYGKIEGEIQINWYLLRLTRLVNYFRRQTSGPYPWDTTPNLVYYPAIISEDWGFGRLYSADFIVPSDKISQISGKREAIRVWSSGLGLIWYDLVDRDKYKDCIIPSPTPKPIPTPIPIPGPIIHL